MDTMIKDKLNILLINKFLYPKGGSETYCFSLAEYLKSKGHDVQFFGMEHERNIVTNDLDLSVSNVEFKGMALGKALYPFRVIYSHEAKRKIGEIVRALKPDIIHLNNYNFQITPSILYEIKKFNIPVVMTLHDFQLICPNHMLYLEHEKKICEECKNRKYFNCIKNRCIHNSTIKSTLAAFEGWVYHRLKTYNKYIDYFVAPSTFLKNKMVEFGEEENRIKVLHNFINEDGTFKYLKKKEYVLYFGRLSTQKGISTLINACKRLPDIKFIFAGGGELESELGSIKNIEFAGFKTGNELKSLVSNALFSICPSEWYENCPMSVLESQMYGTPVIGANIGGIPELIDDGVDGLLFEPGNVEDMVRKIKYLYGNNSILQQFSQKCAEKVKKFSIDKYHDELMKIYQLAIEKHKTSEESNLCQNELYTGQL